MHYLWVPIEISLSTFFHLADNGRINWAFGRNFLEFGRIHSDIGRIIWTFGRIHQDIGRNTFSF
ncbi:hypothetical protein H4O14_15775 [Bacillus sp. PAMC26568]|nr:hypothetical protein H4O14_15775 [Bacillus sp. PAMC26568]